MPRTYRNRLNDLDPRAGSNSRNPGSCTTRRRRRKDVLRHPAKFPETLAQEFIEFFTQRGGWCWTRWLARAARWWPRCALGRHAYGIELNPAYAEIARQVIAEERASLGEAGQRI